MMRQFSRTAIFSLIAMGTMAAVPLSPAQQADTASVQSRELARRQAAVRDARQLVQEARLAYQAKRYSQAVEHYSNALRVLPDVPATKSFSQFVKDSLSDALIAKAIDYRAVGRREEAVGFLQEAVELSPHNERAKVELLYTSDPVRTNPALSPQHLGEVAEVSRLLELAYGQLDLGKFDEAIASFQAVAQYDAYNAAAQRGIEQATQRKSQYYAAAHDANRAKMLAAVDGKWEDHAESPLPGMVAESNTVVAPGMSSELQDSYASRLEKMVMPTIIFDEANVMDVIQALQNQITRFESNGVRSGRHINITPNFGVPDSPGYKDLMSKTVSLNLSQVSVKDVLDMLASQLGISYYYTPSGVELSYSGKDFGPMMERTFSVPPHFFDPAKEEEPASDNEDDVFAESSSSRMKVRRVNPAQVLKEMGVSFPAGATARYSPATRQLHVRNTAYNLEQIQDILNIPMEADRQVVLNVIMMEVSENDLESLGFDWMFNFNFSGNIEFQGGADQAASSVSGMPVFKGEWQDVMGAPPHATRGLRSGHQAVAANHNMDNLIAAGSAAGFAANRISPAPTVFGVRGGWSAADVVFMMNGLSQKKGVDILQNPRIILSPGAEEQVTFANVTELFFPESWEQGKVASASSSYDPPDGLTSPMNSIATVATSAMPTDFVRFGMTEDGIGGIGTILQVHSAEISENGRYVTLALTTTTNDFEGFVNWGSPINSAIWSGSSKIKYFELAPNYILQPVIKRYVENTKITVVPGTVLVMGGLKEAKLVRFEDKVPVLGDLPLVGRLFRSEGEEKVRKALIYFAKVDVIDPTGRDVATGERPSMATDKF